MAYRIWLKEAVVEMESAQESSERISGVRNICPAVPLPAKANPKNQNKNPPAKRTIQTTTGRPVYSQGRRNDYSQEKCLSAHAAWELTGMQNIAQTSMPNNSQSDSIGISLP
jgi:hypothetical protein